MSGAPTDARRRRLAGGRRRVQTDVHSNVWKVSEGCVTPRLSVFGWEARQERKEAAAPGKWDEASRYQHKQARVYACVGVCRCV